jgi:hypothetical protein
MQQQFECLDRSLLIQDLLGGIGTDLNFKVNGNVHPHYTCLSMASILDGHVLYQPSMNHEEKNTDIIYPSSKKQLTQM